MEGITIVPLDCRDKFLTNGKYWLHAIFVGRVVGSIAIEQHGPDWVWLNDLFVHEPFRRRGIGRLLVQNALSHSTYVVNTAIGCCCGIRRENQASQQLFRGCRFIYVWEDGDGVRLYSCRLR